ncbi:MAG: hypothetical protein ACTSVI_17320 [Promethearchaeota archaeon]
MNVDSLKAVLKEMLDKKDQGELSNQDMFKIIDVFNHSMLDNVTGPNCTDRNVCNDNCCGIMIDIPHFLAEKYIMEGYIKSDDVRRGDVFAWILNIHEDTDKCCFFSEDIFGCQIYVDNLSIRPPQCAVYPAGYVEGASRCKANAGPWIVKDQEVGKICEGLMNIYKDYCINERETIESSMLKNINLYIDDGLMEKVTSFAPSMIVGIKDTWDGFDVLKAEGVSLSYKEFCDKASPGCTVDYRACKSACAASANLFIDFLKKTLPIFIQERGIRENYLLMDLKSLKGRVKS